VALEAGREGDVWACWGSCGRPWLSLEGNWGGPLVAEMELRDVARGESTGAACPKLLCWSVSSKVFDGPVSYLKGFVAAHWLEYDVRGGGAAYFGSGSALTFG
jgi:hypothetical protein